MKIEEIRKIGVVGAGNMGYGIALSFALGGYPTIMIDIDDVLLKNAIVRIRSALETFIEETIITRKQAEDAIVRITASTDITMLAHDVDYVCEAIIERSQDKKEIFNKMDSTCHPDTILASNTSSLMLSDFCSEVKRKQKLVVTHYFNPSHIVPCVEVVKGSGTSDETFNLTYDLLKKVNKLPIRVEKELPGYLVNRIQMAMLREVFDLWAKGVANAEDIDRAISSSFGFRLASIGPLLNLDLSGIPQHGLQVADMFNHLFSQISDSKEIPQELSKRWELRQEFYDYTPEKWEQLTKQRDKELLRSLKLLYRS